MQRPLPRLWRHAFGVLAGRASGPAVTARHAACSWVSVAGGPVKTGEGLGNIGTGATQAANAILDALGRQVVAVRAGKLILVNFGVLSAMGAALALAAAGPILVSRGVPPQGVFLFALASALAVVAGSWAFGVVLDGGPRATAVARPVFVSWGGILGLLLVVFVAAPVWHLPFLFLLDVLARTAPLGHVLGRVGCLTYGCCHGKPAGRFGVCYTRPEAKAVRVSGLGGVRLHPSPLYECGVDLAAFALSNALFLAGAPLGVPTGMALLVYGAGRLVVERTRDSRGRELAPGVTVNQALSIALALAGAATLAWCRGAGGAVPPPVWAVGVEDARWILLASTAAGALTMAGFGIHRGEVGRW